MPFERKYSDEIREQSLGRVLERRASEPGDRSIIRETAAEFGVGEQSLRAWIRAHERAVAPITLEPAPDPADPTAQDDAPVGPASAGTRSGRPGRAGGAGGAGGAKSPGGSGDVRASTTRERVNELELEVARLRRDREALKSAMAVLLAD